MDTENSRQRRRRRHSAELKAQILAECVVPGASVAKAQLLRSANLASGVHEPCERTRDAKRLRGREV
jgi:hypothetical protein